MTPNRAQFSHPDSGRLLRAVKQLFWSLLLLLHLAGIVSIWRSEADADFGMLAIRTLALGLSAGFFALKVADVAWLRLKPGWQPFAVSVAVVAMLHVNVARRAVEGDLEYSPAPMAALLVVGTFVEFDAARKRVLGWARGLASLADAREVRKALSDASRVAAVLDAARRLRSCLTHALLAARPPPAL